MSKILVLIGATVGGALGWWLGDLAGLMPAYLLSVVGTGIGVYVGAHFARQWQ